MESSKCQHLWTSTTCADPMCRLCGMVAKPAPAPVRKEDIAEAHQYLKDYVARKRGTDEQYKHLTDRHREMIAKYWSSHKEGPRMMCCQLLADLAHAETITSYRACPLVVGGFGGNQCKVCSACLREYPHEDIPREH